jgi:6,7-dimethyl-8-ribityllumazine synthase
MMRTAQATGVPVAFGLLTTNTVDEAVARSIPGPANKGREAAMAAVAMARLYRRLAGDAGAEWDES